MRGLRTETLRETNIFRWSEDLGATLFFDVLNLWKKAEREKLEDLFLNRFEKGAKAARVLNPEKGPFEDTRYFDIFGATIIATNESVHKILGYPLPHDLHATGEEAVQHRTDARARASSERTVTRLARASNGKAIS